ncbi:MAG: HisA/HisF-related TIM barrel protein, partial [Promethearchaeota archaeon]
AVHAIEGRRTHYTPLKSVFFKTKDPFKIVEILRNDLYFKEIYIADLDAIINRKPSLNILKKIQQLSGIEVMLDPGITTINDIATYLELNLGCLILGLETIESLDIVLNSVQIYGKKNIILSLDMYDGNVISKLKEKKFQNPLNLIEEIETLGVNRVILLDLKRVGSKIGGIPPLFLEIRRKFQGDLLVGGGIKDLKDIEIYKKHDFSGVLIATALYDGSISKEKVKELNS